VVVLFYLRWLVSRPAVNRRYLKAKKLFDRCAAGVMAALGLRLLLNPR
jgi:threonine/homoserine/homoserine lactone efflux protein